MFQFDPSWLNEPGFDQSMLTPQISFSDQVMREMHGVNGPMLMEVGDHIPCIMHTRIHLDTSWN